MLTSAASSQKLMECLINLEVPGKVNAKLDLALHVSEMMPHGKPAYLDVIKYPMISQLIEKEGKKKMLGILVLIVKNFCSSLNVVRNMSEDQMIESAVMLMDECGNFRLEDYMMMFAMAKKGDLVKIMDRVDINMITLILDEYWKRRENAAHGAQDAEINRIDSLGSTTRKIEFLSIIDQKMLNGSDSLGAAMEEMKARLSDNRPTETVAEAIAKIEKVEKGKQQHYPKGYKKSKK